MYLIYGVQKSGMSIIKFLKKNNKKFKIWDDNTKVRSNLKKKFDNNLFFRKGYSRIINTDSDNDSFNLFIMLANKYGENIIRLQHGGTY